jgi:hypothetical protein
VRIGRRGVIALVVVAIAAGGTAAGVVLTEGSSGPSGKARYAYPEAARKSLLNACAKRGSSSYCGCVLRAYQDTVPYSDYSAILQGGITATRTSLQHYQAFQAQSSHCQL